MQLDKGALRNFKDFLQMYNRMTEMCFSRCVDNINSRKLDDQEIECVEDCSMKFVKYNNRLMQNFVVAQQEVVNKRVAEATKAQQQQLENESNIPEAKQQNVPDISGMIDSNQSEQNTNLEMVSR
ncbi:unnamed protein product [Acanthoscelides obtectus]|uniref:Mitochondrial import inner membrane translocase subunit n=1 Tax=Acanthoscelides obtectus TaxID=200917 RepID=A0A9P0JJ39_ACAOB|nr:unnamed protein product [Acanthoscelides obtectus]CAK1628926.1 Mitochondrial import inner membrane translocase subunit Tim10 B [Acanthoscelides obtectus]